MQAPSFADIAEIILRDFGQALRAEDIVRIAIERGELNTRGATPIDSMRARLSEDIIRKGPESRFKRTAANLFALRSLPENEYVAPRFEKLIGTEAVACSPQATIRRLNLQQGHSKDIERFLSRIDPHTDIVGIARQEAECRSDFRQYVVYVLLRTLDGRVLSYRRGAYTTADNSLRGALCIGFGGHVHPEEPNSFFAILAEGFKTAVLREIGEELPGLQIADLQPIGTINDETSPNGLRHLALTWVATLPAEFAIQNQETELSINEIRLLTKSELVHSYDDMEYWSQLLFKAVYCGARWRPGVRTRGAPPKPAAGPVVIVGEIGAGKSVVAEIAKTSFEYQTVSTRECVSSLIGESDFGVSGRAYFQEKARALVSTPDGLDDLAREIARRVDGIGAAKCIVDGLRNVGTLERLRDLYPNLYVLFVDAPKDQALRQYIERSGGKSTVHDFRDERAHGVEREVPLLRRYADGVIFNGGTMTALRKTVSSWLGSGE